MIRITTQTHASGTVIKIDGWLAKSDLAELRRIREQAEGGLSLHLGGLDTCAPDGIRLLQEWLQDGAKLESASPFLQMILESPLQNTDRRKFCAEPLESATV